MVRIVPAILAHDLAELSARLRVSQSLTGRVQVDIIDGEFAENTTVQLEEMRSIPELKIDLHLMVDQPEEKVKQAISLKPNLVTFQFEAHGDKSAAIDQVVKNGLRAGIAINPETPISRIKPFIEQLAQVLLLGVQAGFAGQQFDPTILSKVADIRKIKHDIEIAVDGGITPKTLKLVRETDVDIAYCNSYIFGSEDPMSRYSELLEATNV